MVTRSARARAAIVPPMAHWEGKRPGAGVRPGVVEVVVVVMVSPSGRGLPEQRNVAAGRDGPVGRAEPLVLRTGQRPSAQRPGPAAPWCPDRAGRDRAL